MTEVRRMTRGTVTVAQLVAALEELGVRSGEDFLISKATAPDAPKAGGARWSDPSTSKTAAEKYAPTFGTQRGKAYDAIRQSRRGLTAYEVGEITGIDGIWKRLSELEQGGYVKVDGERFITAHGTHQQVYVIARPPDTPIEDEGQYETTLFASEARPRSTYTAVED